MRSIELREREKQVGARRRREEPAALKKKVSLPALARMCPQASFRQLLSLLAFIVEMSTPCWVIGRKRRRHFGAGRRGAGEVRKGSHRQKRLQPQLKVSFRTPRRTFPPSKPAVIRTPMCLLWNWLGLAG